MPTPPKESEKKEEFLSRCHSYIAKNEKNKDVSQSSAICHSMWRNKNKDTRYDSDNVNMNHDRVFCFKLDSEPSTMHIDEKTGFLHCKGVFTRSGVFNYYDNNGTLMRELRSEEEVFATDSLLSLQMIPITDQHPTEMITTENVKDYLVGMVGENISRKDDYVTGSMIITDKDMTETIIARKDSGLTSELSGGYNCKVIKEEGVHNKDGHYDHKQTDIRYNHLSIVPAGRAGRNVRIMDAKDKNDDAKKNKEDKMTDLVKFIRSETKLDSFKVDAISCEVSEEAYNAVETLSTKLDEAITLINDLTKKTDELQGTVDQKSEVVESLNKDIAVLKDPNSPEIEAMVKSRNDVEKVAAGLKLDTGGKTIQDIKVECIKSVSPKFDSEGKSVDYINARFDAVIETIAADKKDKDNDAVGEFNKNSRKDKESKLSPREQFLKLDAENRK